MTTIIGWARKGKVYMGGDSLVGFGYIVYPLNPGTNGKVFKVGNFIFGVAGVARTAQILRFHFCPPGPDKDDSDVGYLVTVVVEHIRDIMTKYGNAGRGEDGEDKQIGHMLIGYNGHLYQCDSNYQIFAVCGGVLTLGTGGEVALGAMTVCKDLGYPPKTAIKKALQIAARFDSATSEPFVIETLGIGD